MKKVVSDAWSGVEARDALHQQRRRLIVVTAARIFADKGYDKASIDDVGKVLNVSKATIYYYLKSKENILVEIVTLAVEQLDEAVASRDDQSGLERVYAFMRAYMHSLLSDLGRCMFMNINRLPATNLMKRVRKAQRQLHERLYQAVLQGVKDGSIVANEPKLLTQMLFGTYHTIPTWFHESGPLTLDEIHQRFMLLVRKGIDAS